MLASLGLFVFELASLPFEEDQHNREWRHEPAKRVGARDGAQFVGPGDEVRTLSGVIAPGTIGGRDAIDTLVEMADTGEPYSLVDGNGRVHGQFVIIKLDTRRKHLMHDGEARLIDFAIDLKRIA